MGYYSHGYGDGGGRKRKSPVEMIVRLTVVAVAIFFFNRWFLSREADKPPTPPAAQQSGPPAATATLDDGLREQIARDLQPATQPVVRDGIAVIILVDTSGSMGDRVAGPQGRRIVKLDAARQAVNELIDTTARLKAERLAVPVLLGVYEFSERPGPGVRQVMPLAEPDAARAREAVAGMKADGGTPIGPALIQAKRDLDRSGMSRQHILIVTDGEHTSGPAPHAVLEVMYGMSQSIPASVYFVAFDIEAAKFDAAKEQGAVVLPASDADTLRQTLDSVLTERILVE